MEFTRELKIIDEALVDLQQRENDLLHQCNDLLCCSVTDHLRYKISANELQASVDYMRKVNLFLVLNSDLTISDLLADDLDVGHIVARNLNIGLLVRVIWGLNLQTYFYETIVYCPPAVSNDLLEFAIQMLKTEECICVEEVEQLSHAIYLKIWRIERNEEQVNAKNAQCIQHRFFGHFLALTNLIYTSYVKQLLEAQKNSVATESFGKSLHASIRLLKSCFTLYIGTNQFPKPRQYEMTDNYDYYGNWQGEKPTSTNLSNFNLKILSLNREIFENITIDVWCLLAELDTNITGTSFQKLIGEEIHSSLPILDELNRREKLSEIETIIQIFSSMATKPWDEDDELKTAGLDLILKNMSNSDKTQSKWLQALLEFDDNVLSNATCLESLEENVSVVSFDLYQMILKNIVFSLKAMEHDVEYQERLRTIALTSLKKFPLHQQIQAVKGYFEENGLSTALYSSNFTSTLTEVFNKTVATSDKENQEFVSECISLLLQSPQELFHQLLLDSMANIQHAPVITKTLKMLNFFGELNAYQIKDQPSKVGFLEDLLILVMERSYWTKQESKNLPKVVSLFIKNRVIHKKVFLESCLIPVLIKSADTKCWEMLSLWLQTLSEIDIQDDCLNMAPLLATLIQVLEGSRCNLTTFTATAAEVCEQTSIIVEMIVSKYLVKNQDCLDQENDWQRKFLPHICLSPLNRTYLFVPSCTNETSICEEKAMEVIFFQVLHKNHVSKVSIKIFESTLSLKLFLVHTLVKHLPSLTSKEWNNLCGLRNLFLEKEADKATSVLLLFDVLTDSMMILSKIVGQHFRNNKSSVSCLNFCFHHYALVLKNEVLPILKFLSTVDVVTLFQRSIFAVEGLPDPIKDPCTTLLLTVLIPIMSTIVDCVRNASGNKLDLVVKELCCAISMSTIPEAKIVLSRKLASQLKNCIEE